MNLFLAAPDPAQQWGDTVFNIDTFSLAAAGAFDFVILLVSILLTVRLKNAGYRSHGPMMVSFCTYMFFEAMTKVLRIGNLLTYTETFSASPWSLPLTMCRVANATTTLVFLTYFIIYIWGLRMTTPGSKGPLT